MRSFSALAHHCVSPVPPSTLSWLQCFLVGSWRENTILDEQWIAVFLAISSAYSPRWKLFSPHSVSSSSSLNGVECTACYSEKAQSCSSVTTLKCTGKETKCIEVTGTSSIGMSISSNGFFYVHTLRFFFLSFKKTIGTLQGCSAPLFTSVYSSLAAEK